jgi:RES domain-containing protein
MKLTQLPFVSTHTLPSPTTLYRVQRTRARPASVTIGRHLHVPPAGTMAGRFNLKLDTVGYFSGKPETATYETMVRRPAAMVSLSEFSKRSLVTTQSAQPLNLLDLRAHAHDWPALQSPRYAPMWELAEDAYNAGYDGVVYYSAQQHGAECYAIFGRAMKHLTRSVKVPLVHASGALHAIAAKSIIGAQVMLVP